MRRQVKHSRRYDGNLQSLTVIGEQEETVYAANKGKYNLGTADSCVQIICVSGVIYVNGVVVPTINKKFNKGVKIMVKVTVGAFFCYRHI